MEIVTDMQLEPKRSLNVRRFDRRRWWDMERLWIEAMKLHSHFLKSIVQAGLKMDWLEKLRQV